MASSSNDFLYILSRQQQRSSKVITKDINAKYIRPSSSPRNGLTETEFADVRNKDKTTTIIKPLSVDIYSIEAYLFIWKRILLCDGSNITASKKMLINNDLKGCGNVERLSTYHYDAVRGNKGLRDGTEIQTSPRGRTKDSVVVGFYCLKAFSLCKDICSSEIRYGQFLDGRKERNGEKRGRLKTEIPFYYVSYLSQLKNNSSPLDEASDYVLGSKTTYLRARYDRIKPSDGSISDNVSDVAHIHIFRHKSCMIHHDNRLNAVSLKSLPGKDNDRKIHSCEAPTSLLLLAVRDTTGSTLTTSNRPIKLSLHSPDLKSTQDFRSYDIPERWKTQYDPIKGRTLFGIDQNLRCEIPTERVLVRSYMLMIFHLALLSSLRLSDIVIFIGQRLHFWMTSFFVQSNQGHARLPLFYFVKKLLYVIKSATHHQCSFLLRIRNTTKTAETRDIANLTIFNYATIVSIGRLPVALLQLIQTIKLVLCYLLSCIWNTIRQYAVFDTIKMPNLIARKSSIVFDPSSSDTYITSSSSSNVYLTSMYSNQKIAFDKKTLWMLLVCHFVMVTEGLSTYDNKRHGTISQIICLTGEHSIFELPDNEEIHNVHRVYSNPQELSIIYHQREPQVFSEFLIVKGYLLNKRVILPQIQGKKITKSQEPDQSTVPMIPEPINRIRVDLQYFELLSPCTASNEKCTGRNVPRILHFWRPWGTSTYLFACDKPSTHSQNWSCLLEQRFSRHVRSNIYKNSSAHIDVLRHGSIFGGIGLSTRQLSNSESRYLGAANKKTGLPLLEENAKNKEHIGSIDSNGRLNNWISLNVSMRCFAISFGAVSGSVEFLFILFFVYVSMILDFPITMPKEEDLVIDVKWTVLSLAPLIGALIM